MKNTSMGGVCLAAAILLALGAGAATAEDVTNAADVARGGYLIRVGGCNDCHTPGFMQAPGEVPESQWLTGSPLGWRGPWGTTYASNLRVLTSEMTEDSWVLMCQTRKARPPMPWFSLNSLSDSDARAVYRYIRSLGTAGEKMPMAVGPDATPQTPYLNLAPQGLGATAEVKELRLEKPEG